MMVRYRVKRDRVGQNLELLANVYAELQTKRPGGLRYASFRLADEVSFVDLVETDGPGRFSQLRSFREFRSSLEERCEEPPVLGELRAIDSYNFDRQGEPSMAETPQDALGRESSTGPLRVAIIVGSTRPGRQAPSVARWVNQIAEQRSDASFELVDIADYALPHLDEPMPPLAGRYSQPHTLEWAAKVASFDAYVFVTPEYNHSTSAALKNAIDFLYAEWNDKSAGFVSYGIDGGVRAVEHLRLVMGEIKIADVRVPVTLSFAEDFRGYTDFTPSGGRESMVTAMLDEVIGWGTALRGLRSSRSQ